MRHIGCGGSGCNPVRPVKCGSIAKVETFREAGNAVNLLDKQIRCEADERIRQLPDEQMRYKYASILRKATVPQVINDYRVPEAAAKRQKRQKNIRVFYPACGWGALKVTAKKTKEFADNLDKVHPGLSLAIQQWGSSPLEAFLRLPPQRLPKWATKPTVYQWFEKVIFLETDHIHPDFGYDLSTHLFLIRANIVSTCARSVNAICGMAKITQEARRIVQDHLEWSFPGEEGAEERKDFMASWEAAVGNAEINALKEHLVIWF